MKRLLPLSSLLKPGRIKALLSFGVKGYLAETGWFRSFDSRTPVDVQGQPIPWVTYSFIDFISERIRKEHRIFEFGSGNSTWFYAKNAGKVVAVEHDRAWYEKVLNQKPANAEIIFSKLVADGAYSRMPLTGNEQYDIIIVDGRDRVNCCRNCLPALAEGGVIVLDDSERDFYGPAIEFLTGAGFRHLSFSGISPGLFYRKTTSVFYKPNNCLGV
ncbi:MAG TPA: class I SAM-dependent methyltransferase [Sphingobacteriaceae bacterium]